MRRRRVSSSASRKFWADRCCSRRSKEAAWVEEEGVENDVVAEIEKVLMEKRE